MLQKFGMMDYKSMATPMITKLNKLRGFESRLVDPSMYQWLIGLLMYLVNTRLDIFFAVNTSSRFQVESRHER